MTRRAFLQTVGKLLLSLGLMPYFPQKAKRAMARSLPASLTTPPADGFQALLFCDSQCGWSDNGYTVWADTLAAAWEHFPEASFFTDIGDMVDNGVMDWHWDNFLNVTSPYIAAHTFYPIMGNHECYDQDWKNCLPQRFLKTFTFPGNGSREFHGYYYAFVQPPVQFIVLNTQMLELDEFLGQGRLLKVQLEWLKKNFKKKTQPWTVVLMHKDILAYDEPQASTGSTGGFSDAGKAFLPALEELGADLILTGHMHGYRRRGPLNGWSEGTKGPVCIMSGPAGSQTYFVPDDPLDKAAIAQPTEPNYLVMNASPAKLTTACLTTSNKLVDIFSLKK